MEQILIEDNSLYNSEQDLTAIIKARVGRGNRGQQEDFNAVMGRLKRFLIGFNFGYLSGLSDFQPSEKIKLIRLLKGCELLTRAKRYTDYATCKTKESGDFYFV